MSRPKQQQILKIEPPSELKFKGPFNDVVTSELHLTNPSDKRVCFKVKTTAPRRYCVRPNSGFIDSDASVIIAVMLQPFDSDPIELLKHKFMVQTMFASNASDDLESLWKDANPSDLMDSKLKCVFEQPAEQTPVKSEAATPTPMPGVDKESELGAIMEEQKRLQQIVAKLKLENDELKSRPDGFEPSSKEGLAASQKRIILIFLIVAFVTGVSLGYILS